MSARGLYHEGHEEHLTYTNGTRRLELAAAFEFRLFGIGVDERSVRGLR
jgi:hypothetical protein